MREQTRVLAVLAAVAAGAVLTMAPPASAATTTTTTLVSSANPSTAGQAVTLTSTVTGDAPGGTVDFVSCHHCEHRRWEEAGADVPVAEVLLRTARR